mmetsp:Transcript_29756/g.53334  ORF Transcript_29756/g.53334 Transcript_29756/m.53334 type:complete len:189 (-) Transcript_29756:1078-1644(-)
MATSAVGGEHAAPSRTSREQEYFQLVEETLTLRQRKDAERRRLCRAQEGLEQSQSDGLMHKSMVPLLAHHVTSWQRESRRATKQLQFAETVKHLYPSGIISPAHPTWDYERGATTRHYTNCLIRTGRERDAIQAELQQSNRKWAAAMEEQREAEKERQQASMSLAELEEKEEHARERLFDAVFGHTWR